ncbi:MAG: trypsin-like peptidase domain-containing protein [Candidatus Bathyarchaeota archaeon]|nr:trypsin-like peptidase domain-containing protein [Candidatus Bathyarchaeota archaeon]
MEEAPADFPEVSQQPQPSQQTNQPKKAKRFPVLVLAAILLVGLIGGGLIGYSLSYATFNGRINDLQVQLQNLPTNATYVSYPNMSYLLGDNVSLAALYSQVQQSVVVIQDFVPQYSFFGLVGYAQQQGSGFVTLVDDQPVIVTNNHVVQNAVNVTVTFGNGDSYPATVLGTDPQADLAVLAIDGDSVDLQPLTLVSSSSLQVGDPVVAVGSPYGLSGTLTTGVVSSLGRTITETDGTQNGGINIPDVIQTSTAINPGNSGGPLINYRGEVVGITTAAVSNSEGLGFAIPSETIIRELSALVNTGSYDQHPTINAVGTDMNYQIAQAVGVDVTYGWLVESVSVQNGLEGGNKQVTVLGSQIVTGGDIIIGIGGTRIANTDDLLAYLERHTLPGQTVDFTVIRDGQTQTVSVTIGKLST